MLLLVCATRENVFYAREYTVEPGYNDRFTQYVVYNVRYSVVPINPLKTKRICFI
jgi:hypothetical protein